jgi:hypothetical protein
MYLTLAILEKIRYNSSVQFSSVQFSSVQFSSVQFSSVQFSSVQFSRVLFVLEHFFFTVPCSFGRILHAAFHTFPNRQSEIETFLIHKVIFSLRTHFTPHCLPTAAKLWMATKSSS